MHMYYVHMFEWTFESVWADTVDDVQTNNEGTSKVIGLQAPDTGKNGVKYEGFFNGPRPTIVNLLLTPTFYYNAVDEFELSGYRAHL